MVFSPDGTKLASTGSDRKVLLWDMTDAVPLGHRLSRPQTEVPAVAFSPDGLTLATLDQSGVIMLWDVTSRRPARGPLVIPRPGGLVRSLAFSPDGRWLIAGGAPRRRESAVERISEAQLFRWDVTSNYLPVGEPLSAHDEIVKIAFSPKGDRLATAAPRRRDHSVGHKQVATRSPPYVRPFWTRGRSDVQPRWEPTDIGQQRLAKKNDHALECINRTASRWADHTWRMHGQRGRDTGRQDLGCRFRERISYLFGGDR